MAASTVKTKEYGLIKRNSRVVIRPKLSVFDDDSDEDGRGGIGKSLQKEACRIQMKKQLKVDLQTALAEDPTVFQYDDVYDDIVEKKKQQTGWQKRNDEKKPKYIDSLLKAAKSRKLEQERALERKVQREREAEGEEFAGKEAFVTTAYKKKMEEIADLEEKERREAQIEALTDVTKQKDLSGFYRNLYKQTLGSNEQQKSSSDINEPCPSGISTSQTPALNDNISNSDDNEDQSYQKRISPSMAKVKRQLRKRRSSSSTSSSDSEKLHIEYKPHNLDPDLDDRESTSNHHRFKQNTTLSRSDKNWHSDSSDADLKATCYQTLVGKDNHVVKKNRHDRGLSTESSDHSGEEPKYSSKKGHTGDHRHGRLSSVHSKKKVPLDNERVDSGNCATIVSKKCDDKPHSTDRARNENTSPLVDDSSTPSDLPKLTNVEISQESALTSREKLILLFKKRHVDQLFEDARERYLNRKAARRTIAVTSAES